jgi:hypothetical protein
MATATAIKAAFAVPKSVLMNFCNFFGKPRLSDKFQAYS